MKYLDQEPPNAVQIELVEGCNLRCAVCGLNGIRGKANDYKAMTPSTLRGAILQMVKLNWNPRIEFAMHGEPSMHPQFNEMIRVAREAGPRYQIMMTSNGGGFLSKPGPAAKVLGFFEAGGNVLAFDDYENANLVPKIRKSLEGTDLAEMVAGIKVFEYPQESGGNPHARGPVTERKIVFIQDLISASKGTHSHVNNHAGAGGPPNEKGQGKRCAKPFRELAIRWDGSVAVCCNDWRGIYQCGNVIEDGLDEVWNGKAMGAARVKLYHRERDFGPCAGCDAISHRVGLLPDKLGKFELAKPDASVARDIKAALAKGPLTVPVLRPWETKGGAAK
jgi:MoaA/NifB/PqqE/SkfB family radical SAM enzyme